MPDYRLYSIAKSTRVMGVEIITCDTDEEAIEKATKLMEDHGIELWQGRRFVTAVYSN
jgi:hypothetical protein